MNLMLSKFNICDDLCSRSISCRIAGCRSKFAISDYRYECSVCLKKYKYAAHLKTHLPKHDYKLRIKCTLCNLYYFNKATQYRHLLNKHFKPLKQL